MIIFIFGKDSRIVCAAIGGMMGGLKENRFQTIDWYACRARKGYRDGTDEQDDTV